MGVATQTTHRKWAIPICLYTYIKVFTNTITAPISTKQTQLTLPCPSPSQPSNNDIIQQRWVIMVTHWFIPSCRSTAHPSDSCEGHPTALHTSPYLSLLLLHKGLKRRTWTPHRPMHTHTPTHTHTEESFAVYYNCNVKVEAGLRDCMP